ncbi:hypothetical protein [uncultured Parolsenella sp.]|uniref:hypothetical protein n=1 Tax=uncultured Parolsenella sp. TaxID=2083008 RepID=UPI0025E87197|nr:hypothetical protein [uncultured Parolsenella sp.]
MALTDAQRRAQEAYRKRSVKQVAVRFYPAEDDLWTWLSARENKAGYIKALIRADMEARRGEGEVRPSSLLSS